MNASLMSIQFPITHYQEREPPETFLRVYGNQLQVPVRKDMTSDGFATMYVCLVLEQMSANHLSDPPDGLGKPNLSATL